MSGLSGGSGLKLKEPHLRHVFEVMSGAPFVVSTLPQCGFLHFGTSRQFIESGNNLLSLDCGTSRAGPFIGINNMITGDGQVAGPNPWVEGCRVISTLVLSREYVAVGGGCPKPYCSSRKICPRPRTFTSQVVQ